MFEGQPFERPSFDHRERGIHNIFDTTNVHTGSGVYFGELSRRTGVNLKEILQDKEAFDERIRKEYLFPHTSESIEQELVAQSYTFGVFEPTYFSLLGKEGVQSMREKESPRCLLVGSLGKYSTQEFESFLRKINNNTQIFVIDNNINLLSLLKNVSNELEMTSFSFADGRQMPFTEESFDFIFTNHLFHFMLRRDAVSEEKTSHRILQFLNESQRVLKKKGSLILAEQEYGYYKKNKIPYERRNEKFIQTVQSSSFQENPFVTPTYRYALREDKGSFILGENGEVDYGNTLILKARDEMGARMVKR
ncbi:MAG: class I SAM-dependent methyltransferase [Candidatus Moranbacteria bacterium]|nr:class I SAM-dependent methyltransferase [Candidatus Moranbacteria bacterium]